MSPPNRASHSQRARQRLGRAIPSVQTLIFLLGLGTTFWIAVGWASLRMREGRDLVKAERERKERLRQHFSSTLTNISFTVYALLPTLSTQVFSTLDVEGSIAELTDLASAGSSEKSKSMESSGILSEVGPHEEEKNGAPTPDTAPATGAEDRVEETPRGSMLLDRTPNNTTEREAATSSRTHERMPTDTSSQTIMPSHSSWASEFTSSQIGPTGRERQASVDRSAVETASDISDLGGMTSGSELDVSSPEHETRHGPSVPPPSSTFTNPSLPSETSPRESSGISMTGSSPSPPESSALHLSSGNVTSSVGRFAAGDGLAIALEKQEVPKERKTKAQLWNEVKIKSITRSITSIYIIPLLVLQTTSQLTLLSRLHLLRGMSGERLGSSTKPKGDSDRASWTTEYEEMAPNIESAVLQGKRKVEEGVGSMWTPWRYFSVENMGLAGYAKEASDAPAKLAPHSASGTLAGISSLVGSLSGLLYQTSPASPSGPRSSRSSVSLEDAVDVETERAFLCYSWWFLHVGWKILADRVEAAVVEVFDGVGLKKALTIDDWAEFVGQVRQRVEAEPSSDGTFTPFELLPSLLPPSDPGERRHALSKWPASEDCPFLDSPPPFPLSELLQQTRLHLTSPDFSLVLPICIDVLYRALLDELAAELYPGDDSRGSDGGEGDVRVRQLSNKRVVECLPAFTKWSKRVWEGIPDEVVDRILGKREVEAFTALVYGDFRESTGLS